MCLSKAYVARNGERELLVAEVTSVDIDGDRLLFKTLFGERKEITANIREIDFMTHSILLGNLKEEGISPLDT